MSISSGLIPYVEAGIRVVGKYNIIPFTSPFILKRRKSLKQLNSAVACKQIISNKAITYLEFHTSDQYCNHQWQIHLAVLMIASILAGYRYIFESHKREDKILNAWKFAFYIPSYVLTWNYRKNAKGMANYFNQLLHFERHHLSQEWKSNQLIVKSKFAVLLTRVMIAIIHKHPFLFSLGSTLLPFTSWGMLPKGFHLLLANFAAHYLEQSKTITFLIDSLERAVAFVVTFSTWRILGNLGVVSVAVNMVAGMYCLQATLDIIKMKMTTAWSGTTAKDFRDIYSNYRTVQVLCMTYNEHHKHSVLLAWVIIGAPTLSISLYLIIARWAYLDFPALFIFINFSQSFICKFLLCLRYGSQVYMKSGHILTLYSRNDRSHFATKRQKLNRKFWKGLPRLKVYLFGSNFLDQKTPVVLLIFAFEMAVNLILIKGKQE